MYFPDRGFQTGFQLFQVIFTLMFILVFGTIVVTLVREISQWNKNNHSPRLTVGAKVVAKRCNVSHRRSGTNGHRHTRTSTSYYVTFEVESGDRMELHMAGNEYGLLVEGDTGRLTFQGTRYLGFERSIL